ncbi:MAG TPA: hypothetical protein VIJ04_06815 [Xanthobacteraceae bacterium]
MALFGAAAVHAAPNNSPAKDTTGKDASPAISLDQLGGTWKNAKSGVNVRIEQGTVGWEVWFSTTGEARITLPEKNRPAIKIDGRNFTCSYSVTLPTSQSMKWDLTQGKPESQCLTGVFSRVAPVHEAKQVAKHAPAAVRQPPEVKKPRQPERVVEPPPASGGAPGMASAPTMPRHAALYRKPPPRTVVRHRRWRAAAAARWRYAVSRYSPYRYFHHHYRWYVVFIPRCGCH